MKTSSLLVGLCALGVVVPASHGCQADSRDYGAGSDGGASGAGGSSEAGEAGTGAASGSGGSVGAGSGGSPAGGAASGAAGGMSGEGGSGGCEPATECPSGQCSALFDDGCNGTLDCSGNCGEGERCEDDACVPDIPGSSCDGLAATCGPSQSEDCCRAFEVPGGTFPMGRSESGTDADPSGSPNELPEHSVTVSSFSLDKYEVTRGRFRNFVAAYDAWRSSGEPSADSGAHPNIAGSGWQSGWNVSLPADAESLVSSLCSWSASPGATENHPMCMSWYTAFAFCIWDGGRLPTEAEWEYTAAGANLNRLYPWGAASPDETRATYNCNDPPGGPQTGCNLPPVGSTPQGNGQWGHADLAGSLWEWTLDHFNGDWYGSASASGLNVANLASPESPGSGRVRRGGNYSPETATNYIRAAYRHGGSTSGGSGNGARCARNP